MSCKLCEIQSRPIAYETAAGQLYHPICYFQAMAPIDARISGTEIERILYSVSKDKKCSWCRENFVQGLNSRKRKSSKKRRSSRKRKS